MYGVYIVRDCSCDGVLVNDCRVLCVFIVRGMRDSGVGCFGGGWVFTVTRCRYNVLEALCVCGVSLSGCWYTVYYGICGLVFLLCVYLMIL